MKNEKLIIYQTEDGKVKIETHFENETVWLSTEQIAELFQRDRTVITKHICNIFKEDELEQELVCANFAHTTQHGAVKGLTQSKNVKHYNLDVIISVGYRVKSHRGVHFRKWATALIKEYLKPYKIKYTGLQTEKLQQKQSIIELIQQKNISV